MKGFEINDDVISMVVCSGCIDLYHICQVQNFSQTSFVCKASEFFHLPLLVLMKKHVYDVNSRDKYVEFQYFLQLLFI